MKKIFNKEFLKVAFGAFVVLALFVLASVFADKYQVEMQALVANEDGAGMVAYVFLTIIAVVLAPMSTLPLIPLASKMWGGFMAGILSVAGWTIGAQIVFLLARHFGKPLVKKIVSLDRLRGIEDRVPNTISH